MIQTIKSAATDEFNMLSWMNTRFYKIVDCLLNNYIYIRPLICLELQEFEAITPGYVIRTKGLLYIAKGAVLGSPPSHKRMLFTTICKVPAPGTLKRKST